jgi:hypothetical protein
MTSSRGGLSTTVVAGARSVVGLVAGIILDPSSPEAGTRGWIIAKSCAFLGCSLHAWVRSAGHTPPAGSETQAELRGGAAMDATCRFCGKPAEFGAVGDGDAACGACARRAQRRRAVFDVSEIETPPSSREGDARSERASDAPSSPPEEMRMLDLLALAKRTRQALATAPEADLGDGPLSVHEAILLVDSIAPASMEEPPTIEATPIPAPAVAPEAPPAARASTPPPRRRMHAIYSGIGLLVVMAAMVVAKARVGREVASAAALGPDPGETTAPLSETPQTPSTAAAPVATTKATTVTTATTSPKGPPRAAPPRPRPTVAPPADSPEVRVAAEPTATPHVELLDAMAAAVAAHSAPPAAPKGDPPPTPPGGSGAPSPSARAGTRTSPLRP